MNVIFDMDGLMFDTEKVFIKPGCCLSFSVEYVD